MDHLPRNRKDAPWLWILAAQAEADPSLARRMAIVEVLGDGRPHPGPDLRTAVEDRLGESCPVQIQIYRLMDDARKMHSMFEMTLRASCA